MRNTYSHAPPPPPQYTCTSPLESQLSNIYQTTTAFIPHALSMSLMSHLLTPFSVGPADGTPTHCSTADCRVGEEGHSKTHWLSKALLEVTCSALLTFH